MTPLVALIVVVLVGVLVANVVGRARAGVRSVRSHNRALDTLGHITTQPLNQRDRAVTVPVSTHQAHVRILLPEPEEPPPVPVEPADEELPAVPVIVVAPFRLPAPPPHEPWEIAAVAGEAEIDTVGSEEADSPAEQVPALTGPSARSGLGSSDGGHAPDGMVRNSDWPDDDRQDPGWPDQILPEGDWPDDVRVVDDWPAEILRTGDSAGAGTSGATSNGHGTNGATTYGAGTNGATTNGGGSNGAGSNGAGSNGAGSNGVTTNGHRANGVGADGHGTNDGFDDEEDLTPTGQYELLADVRAVVHPGDPVGGDRGEATPPVPVGGYRAQLLRVGYLTRPGRTARPSGIAGPGGARPPSHRRRPSRRVVAAAVALPILIVAAVGIVVVTDRHARVVPHRVAVARPPQIRRAVPTPSPTTVPVPVKLISSTPGTSLYQLAGSAQITLTANGLCWVEIRQTDATGPVVYSETMGAGATESIAGPVWVRLGNPTAVAVSVGGAAVSPPLTSGQPYNLQFE